MATAPATDSQEPSDCAMAELELLVVSDYKLTATGEFARLSA